MAITIEYTLLSQCERLKITRPLRNPKNLEIDFMEREFIPQGGIRGTLPSKRSGRKGNCLSALARVLALQRSETLQGRKKFISANEGNFQSFQLPSSYYINLFLPLNVSL
jgi:hypothetical protein